MAAGVFCMVGSEILPASLLDLMAEELSVSVGLAGQAVTVTAGVALLTSVAFPSIAGRRDRKAAIIALTSLMVAANALVAVAGDYWIMLLGRVALGIAIGGYWSLASASTLKLVPERLGARALSVLFSGVAVAAVSVAPVASYVGTDLGWRPVFWCAALVGTMVLLVQALTLPRLPSNSAATLKTIFDILRRRKVAGGIVAATAVYGAYMALQTFLRTLFEAHGFDDLIIAAGFFLLGAGSAMGTAIAGFLVERSVRLCLVGMPIVIGGAAVGLALSEGEIPSMALMFAWGCAWGVVPVAWSFWLTHAVPDQRESASATFVAAVQVSFVTGAALGGLLHDMYGVEFLYICIGSGLILITIPANRVLIRENSL